ncbi:MAG: amidohydrolase [Rhodospirillaceae bacterium]|jgi:predicted amidohydrolase YtcJ|nr:amidohydrolase [Rhodospirillaceae bacterium]HAO58125.1 amidohydrolase [Alphaproteobacteria bacterium]HCA14168.1 amidohydrolase [Alphaproteobacteria bacterium]HCD21076.1 amidohydrolase [Alphaproteobacteria bacterium]HCD79132.1 amidohydrolase [Alphaproteobacteria bacterium]|tara:strand:- start:975 stop:2618 length:1644 start_codon:yes stop_codon:yes gene_type:complete
MSEITVFSARDVITMNASRPHATHVAVRDGRILGAGSLEDMHQWGPFTLNDDFADKTLVPGFVEGHAHAMEGGIWDFPYIGFEDRWDPSGRRWEGAQSLEAAIAALTAAEARLDDAETPLFAWGFDPIYFGEARMNAAQLDTVSTTRPIIVLHSNGHLLNVNSRLMDMAGITADTNVYGVLKDDSGKPTGELMEMAAKYMAYRQTGNPFFGGIKTPSLLRYAESAVNCGVTTATDLFASFNEESLAAYAEASKTPGYALRLMPALNTIEQSIDEGIALAKRALQDNNDRLHHRLCKVMTDGSIQGFTARLKWPGYHNGKPNGLWNLDPNTLGELVLGYHKAGLHLHIHTNGDEASELMLDAVEAAQLAYPRPDHRHTLQHCQMADASQFRRMAKLGVCVNLFANHIYYWGDQHAAITMGPDRANRMDAAGTAQREGVPYAIHSDAPVTPMAPLFTAWCAVNRQTRTGIVLGPEERISAEDALYAITLGAAYTLHMDHLVGSIEPGKFADFAVLEDSPLEVDPEAIRDIGVWGTISGGTPHKAATRTG